LTDDHVHIWRIALTRSMGSLQELQSLLTVQELDRADRFRFTKDRQRFIMVRSLLRVILSRYLDLNPGQLQFVYNQYGKPALAPALVTRGLSFNLSHAHELALVAVAWDRQLGIDLEYIRPIPEIEQITARILSPQEKEIFRGTPAIEKLQVFFHYWTCKEAYIKARGEGLSLPLDQFQVGPILDEGHPLLSVNGDPKEALRWSIRKLIPAPGYVAALVVEESGSG
jgi:4'-phosphopantetheinyl transferase